MLWKFMWSVLLKTLPLCNKHIYISWHLLQQWRPIAVLEIGERFRVRQTAWLGSILHTCGNQLDSKSFLPLTDNWPLWVPKKPNMQPQMCKIYEAVDDFKVSMSTFYIQCVINMDRHAERAKMSTETNKGRRDGLFRCVSSVGTETSYINTYVHSHSRKRCCSLWVQWSQRWACNDMLAGLSLPLSTKNKAVGWIIRF